MAHSGWFTQRFLIGGLSVISVLTLASCQVSQTELNMPPLSQADPMVIPAGFPKPAIPTNNPVTPAKVELGRQLFYEVQLSRDNSKSCASCHSEAASFSDAGNTVSMGVFNQRGSRNAPALVNLAYDTTFFWDGRASTLEDQAVLPILNPVELSSDSISVVAKLSSNTFYKALFGQAFGDEQITMQRIGMALASFERTMISGSSDYDRFMAGDSSALSKSALHGMQLFNSKQVNCVGCHSGVNFTDNNYHSTGLAQFYEDQGRQDVTRNPQDNGKFRTPSLRNVGLTAPYMHDGSFATLDTVLGHYREGGKHNQTQDQLIQRLNISDQDVKDIIAFLNSLTDKNFTQRKEFSKPANQ